MPLLTLTKKLRLKKIGVRPPVLEQAWHDEKGEDHWKPVPVIEEQEPEAYSIEPIEGAPEDPRPECTECDGTGFISGRCCRKCEGAGRLGDLPFGHPLSGRRFLSGHLTQPLWEERQELLAAVVKDAKELGICEEEFARIEEIDRVLKGGR